MKAAPSSNPMIGSTPADTADYVVEAMGALMGFLADTNSGLYRLMVPIEDAMRHQAEALRDALLERAAERKKP